MKDDRRQLKRRGKTGKLCMRCRAVTEGDGANFGRAIGKLTVRRISTSAGDGRGKNRDGEHHEL